MTRIASWPLVPVLLLAALAPPARGAVTREEVERAIREGVRYLKQRAARRRLVARRRRRAHRTGTTSLVTLALLTAGEPADSPARRQGAGLPPRSSPPSSSGAYYAVSLQTMVFAAAEPDRDQLRITGNVAWLETAQIKRGRPRQLARLVDATRRTRDGRATTRTPSTPLLGLNAASEVGVPVKPEVWTLSRELLGAVPSAATASWAYTPDSNVAGHRQHDLRGHLQPGHHRAEALPGAGSPASATRSRTAARGASTRASSAASTGWRATSASARTSADGQQLEVLLPLRPGARRPAHRPALLRRPRLVSRGGRGAGPRRRTSSSATGPGAGARGRTRWSPPASRCCSWPRAAPRC